MTKTVARFEFDNCVNCIVCACKVTPEGYVYKCADRAHAQFDERWNTIPTIKTTPGPVIKIEVPEWCPHRLLKVSED